MMKKILWAVLALLLATPAFAQKLSNLPNGTTPTGTEFIPIVQGGVTVKVTPAQILAYIDAQTITWTNPQTYSQLMTLNNGLTVSAGGIAVNGGGESITSGNFSQTGSGNTLFNNTGYLFSSAVSETTNIGTSTTGVAIGSGSGTTPNISFFNSLSSANNRIWDIYADPTTLHGRAVNDAITTAQDWITVVRNGATISSVNFPNGTFEVAGRPVETYGVFSGNGSGCPLSGYDNSNISGCVRNSTGNYTVSTIVSTTVSFACTSNIVNANGFDQIVSAGTNTVNIQTSNTAGTATDFPFSLICK